MSLEMSVDDVFELSRYWTCGKDVQITLAITAIDEVPSIAARNVVVCIFSPVGWVGNVVSHHLLQLIWINIGRIDTRARTENGAKILDEILEGIQCCEWLCLDLFHHENC